MSEPTLADARRDPAIAAQFAPVLAELAAVIRPYLEHFARTTAEFNEWARQN